MQNYNTVEEKAARWNISPRHIQYLCRNGKIKGAVKRAGSWFIPNDAPSPAKNSKTGSKSVDYVGTKKKIFYSAIELFMKNGFDSVSLRDIADHVGIQQPTIYNHFKSKREILDAIYTFYRHNYLEDRPSLEEMEEGLRNKSLLDVIKSVSYDFNEAYMQEMSDITKIIFQRIGIDNRAREIGKSLMLEEGVKFVEEVFNKAVEMGRLAAFDTHAMSVFINSLRLFTFFFWIVDPSPDNMMKLLEGEQKLYQYSVRLLKDLKPPGANNQSADAP